MKTQLSARRGHLWMRALTILVVVVVGTVVLALPGSAAGPVIHHVSVGGPDSCGPNPGCDGNFSLVAHQYADGRVSGQYTDRNRQGDGLHAVIDCLYVDGNQAWVSGVITHGRWTDPDTGEVYDLSGMPVATTVKDNGTSSQQPYDQISFSWPGDYAFVCTDHPDKYLFDLWQGQVIVR